MRIDSSDTAQTHIQPSLKTERVAGLCCLQCHLWPTCLPGNGHSESWFNRQLQLSTNNCETSDRGRHRPPNWKAAERPGSALRLKARPPTQVSAERVEKQELKLQEVVSQTLLRIIRILRLSVILRDRRPGPGQEVHNLTFKGGKLLEPPKPLTYKSQGPFCPQTRALSQHVKKRRSLWYLFP